MRFATLAQVDKQNGVYDEGLGKSSDARWAAELRQELKT